MRQHDVPVHQHGGTAHRHPGPGALAHRRVSAWHIGVWCVGTSAAGAWASVRERAGACEHAGVRARVLTRVGGLAQFVSGKRRRKGARAQVLTVVSESVSHHLRATVVPMYCQFQAPTLGDISDTRKLHSRRLFALVNSTAFFFRPRRLPASGATRAYSSQYNLRCHAHDCAEISTCGQRSTAPRNVTSCFVLRARFHCGH
jgi:hypothetical protein